MFKSLLASAALGALLATGAFAQTEAPADPASPGADTTAPGAAPGTAAPAPVEPTGDWVVDENFQPADLATLTAAEIIGADLRTADGQVVASVADLILGADGKAESIAAKFGGFLGFGSDTVVLKFDEVEFMQNDAGKVALRTAVTPDSLQGRPAYEG